MELYLPSGEKKNKQKKPWPWNIYCSINVMYHGDKVADTLWEWQLWFCIHHRITYSFDMHPWEHHYLLFSKSKKPLLSEDCANNRYPTVCRSREYYIGQDIKIYLPLWKIIWCISNMLFHSSEMFVDVLLIYVSAFSKHFWTLKEIKTKN